MKTLRLVPLLALSLSAAAATISGNTITEDFTTLEYADLSLPSGAVTTGLWDIAHQRARAHAFANGAAGSTRPIDFGDGSDGVLSTSSGFTFDTTAHPNGYNFQSLSITGGAVTVTGTHPLILRSLSTLTITPAIDVSGANGANGSATGAAIPGPVALTCLANGGAGGAASLAAGLDGGDSLQSNGAPEGNGLYGRGQTGANSSAVDGQGSITGPASNDFENASNFICGSSGPGGGGYSDAATSFGSGAAGGAGGGIIRVASVGDASVGALLARGGNGGNGVTVAAGPNRCSGNGSGGNGGVIWLQTLGNLTTGANPNVTAGASGTSVCFIGSGQSFFDGFTRGDTAQAGARPAWATAAGSYDTDLVPPNLQSTIQSKPYPLGVVNAGFSAPAISSTGSVTVEFAGSGDGVSFGAWTTDVTSLSDQNYRFLRWRANFTNPAAAGASPTLSRVSVPFQELGLTTLDLKLAAGCATIRKPGGPRRPLGPRDGAAALLTFAGFAMLFLLTRNFAENLKLEAINKDRGVRSLVTWKKKFPL